jgi:hypothetical protein
VKYLDGQQFMKLSSVVPISSKVTFHYGLEPFSFNVRPGKTTRIEQHLPNVISEGIPIPRPEMEDFVPAEE